MSYASLGHLDNSMNLAVPLLRELVDTCERKVAKDDHRRTHLVLGVYMDKLGHTALRVGVDKRHTTYITCISNHVDVYTCTTKFFYSQFSTFLVGYSPIDAIKHYLQPEFHGIYISPRARQALLSINLQKTLKLETNMKKASKKEITAPVEIVDVKGRPKFKPSTAKDLDSYAEAGEKSRTEKAVARGKTAAATKSAKNAKPEKEESAPPAKNKKASVSAPRSAFDAMATITVLAEKNPKRPSSAAHMRFSLYKTGLTVAKFLEKGGTRPDLAYDSSHGFIAIK